MGWREEIAKLLMARRAPVVAPLIRDVVPDDPRVLSRLQFDRAQGGVPVGSDFPPIRPANTNVDRLPADVLPFRELWEPR